MREFTDFLLRTADGQEFVFRHKAQTVREFLIQDDDVIFDYSDSQFVRKKDVITARLAPRPFVMAHMVLYNKCPSDVWGWISSLSVEEREEILEKYSEYS